MVGKEAAGCARWEVLVETRMEMVSVMQALAGQRGLSVARGR